MPRGQQQPRGPETSYLVVDKQQPGTSLQLHITINPAKALNPQSVTSVTVKVHTSQDSSLFGNIQSVTSYQQMDTLQPFSPSDPHQHTTSPPTIQQQEPPQPAQPPPPTQAAAEVDLLHLPTIGLFQDYRCEMSFSGQLLIYRSSEPPESSKNN